MRRKKPPQHVGQFLRSFFKKQGLTGTLNQYQIWTHWKDVVGPQLYVRSAPLRIRHGVLYVSVSQSSWMSQLQFMKSQIINRIRETLRVSIHDIRFVLQSSKDSVRHSDQISK